MENYYNILDCEDYSSVEELRRSYLRLVKLYHPDKTALLDRSPIQSSFLKGESNNDMFVKIDKAWKILSDSEYKQRYDAVLKQRLLSQEWPIQDEVDIEEFEEADDDMRFHPCRCGGSYVLSADDQRFQLDFVCCDTCTLCVKVLYNTEQEDQEGKPG